MSRDPQRLLDLLGDEASEIPSILRDGLGAEKAAPGPDADHLRRLEEAFARRLQAGGSSSTPAEGVARTGASWAGKSAAVALCAAIGVATLGAVTVSRGLYASDTSSLASGASRSARVANTLEHTKRELNAAPVGSGGSLADAVPTVTPESLADAPVVKPAKTNLAPSASNSVSETEEIELLGRAQESLRTRPNDALALCRLHESRYVSGRYSQEREAVAIEALVYLNRLPEAERRWDSFQSRYPTSSHRIHLQDLLSSARSKKP